MHPARQERIACSQAGFLCAGSLPSLSRRARHSSRPQQTCRVPYRCRSTRHASQLVKNRSAPRQSRTGFPAVHACAHVQGAVPVPERRACWSLAANVTPSVHGILPQDMPAQSKRICGTRSFPEVCLNPRRRRNSTMPDAGHAPFRPRNIRVSRYIDVTKCQFFFHLIL